MCPKPTLTPAGVAVAPEILQQRAVSVAHRLLDGGGKAAILAVEHSSRLLTTALAHGFSCTGEFVVALAPEAGAQWRQVSPYAAIQVRCLIERELPHLEARILAAVVDIQGALQLADEHQVDTWQCHQQLPDSLALAVQVPGVQFAHMRLKKVALHDISGVINLPTADVRRRHLAMLAGDRPKLFAGADELSAHDVVWGVGEEVLVRIAAAAEREEIPAVVWRRELCPLHAPERQGLYCGDVDETGVALLVLKKAQYKTIFVPFKQPVATLEELPGAITDLSDLVVI